ncbi:hypothetical protein [Clostridium botulinum]|uniref:hypothetical protein n=1 Tax=Clostridium botulinum TaxID=1491 RepID=UPI003EF9ABFE
MKKILSILIIAILSIGLVACGEETVLNSEEKALLNKTYTQMSTDEKIKLHDLMAKNNLTESDVKKIKKYIENEVGDEGEKKTLLYSLESNLKIKEIKLTDLDKKLLKKKFKELKPEEVNRLNDLKNDFDKIVNKEDIKKDIDRLTNEEENLSNKESQKDKDIFDEIEDIANNEIEKLKADKYKNYIKEVKLTNLYPVNTFQIQLILKDKKDLRVGEVTTIRNNLCSTIVDNMQRKGTLEQLSKVEMSIKIEDKDVGIFIFNKGSGWDKGVEPLN